MKNIFWNLLKPIKEQIDRSKFLTETDTKIFNIFYEMDEKKQNLQIDRFAWDIFRSFLWNKLDDFEKAGIQISKLINSDLGCRNKIYAEMELRIKSTILKKVVDHLTTAKTTIPSWWITEKEAIEKLKITFKKSNKTKFYHQNQAYLKIMDKFVEQLSKVETRNIQFAGTLILLKSFAKEFNKHLIEDKDNMDLYDHYLFSHIEKLSQKLKWRYPSVKIQKLNEELLWNYKKHYLENKELIARKAKVESWEIILPKMDWHYDEKWMFYYN